MANTLRFKRGLASGLPTGLAGEPLFTTDTFDLYIGNGTGNTRFQKYIASGTTSQLLRGDGSLLTMPIVLTSPTNGQVLKYNGTNWVNDSDAGITGSGTTNYLPKFTGASTLGNSRIFDNGTNVGIGLITPDVELAVYSASVSRFHLQNLSSGVSATDGLQFAISGLDGYIWNWENGGLFFATNNTQRTRITNGGNFIINNASTDNGLRFQVTGDGYFSGSVGIGGTSISNVNLLVSKNLSTPGVSYGIHQNGSVQSGVSFPIGIGNTPIIAASVSVNGYRSFYTANPSIGAGSTITELVGYYVESNFVGGTSTYAFQGAIPSGTGRWNLYMNGTANNYINGNLGIGTTTIERKLHVVGDVLVAGISGGIYFKDNTNTPFLWVQDAYGLRFGTNNTERMRLDSSGNLGLGVTPSAWSGYKSLDFTGGSIASSGTNNIELWSNAYFDGTNGRYRNNGLIAVYSQTNGEHRWLNAPSGTAGNAITFTQAMTLFATRNLAIGTTTDAGFKLDVNGTMRVSGASTFGTLAIGTGMFWDNTNNRLGIGMSAPDNQLHVRNSTGAAISIHNTSAGSAATPNEAKLIFRGYNIPSNNVIHAEIAMQNKASNFTGGWLIFRTLDSSAVLQDRLIIDNAGAVGIGTTSPDARLRVAGAINSTQAIFGNVDGRGLAISTSAIGGTNDAGVTLNARSSVTSGTFIFQTDGTERVRIKPDGQVRFVPLAAAPTTNVEAGDVYYDSTTNKLRCYNGTTWNDLF